MAAIYADYNATSPMLEVVHDRLLNFLRLPLNPSSLHQYGVQAHRIIESARENILFVLGLSNHKLLFTSSGTEANATIMGSFCGYKHLVSSIEHKSVKESMLSDNMEIAVDKSGQIDLNHLEWMIKECSTAQKVLVSVMMANNETGVLQPIDQVRAVCDSKQAILHTDAVQCLGKVKLFPSFDIAVFSGHKIGAGPGSGVVIFDPQMVSLRPLMRGGGQESGLRAGTENVLSIIGIETAVSQTADLIVQNDIYVRALRDRLEQGILSITNGDKSLIVGYKSPRLPNTSCILMPGVSSNTQVIYFNLHNIAIGSGAACSSRTSIESHVLRAMSVDPLLIGNAIRVSLGIGNTEKDIDCILNYWSDIYKRHN